MINLFTPDAIVLGGSVMKSAALFLDRILAVIGSGCRFVPAEKTHLVLASLPWEKTRILSVRPEYGIIGLVGSHWKDTNERTQ